MRPRLLTTAEQYAALTAAAHAKGKRPAKVDRQALLNLIIDHGAVLAKLRGDYVDQQESPNAGN
jgi:hypothetical protein